MFKGIYYKYLLFGFVVCDLTPYCFNFPLIDSASLAFEKQGLRSSVERKLEKGKETERATSSTEIVTS